MSMGSSLDQLLARARGPLGPSVHADFGTDTGPLGELSRVLAASNGFYLYNAGIQVFRAGAQGLGPDLQSWNDHKCWKDTYGDLAEGLFCFAQDLFGVQHAIVGQEQVVAFYPENAQREEIGKSLDDWAAWLMADPETRGAYNLATAWQDAHGALSDDQRLIPWRFFVFGGTYDFANLTVKPAAECMRIRGPVAQTVHNLAPGTVVQMSDGQHSGNLDLEVMADYHQIHLEDERSEVADVFPDWGRQLVTRRVASNLAEPTLVGVGTARSAKVPVSVDITPAALTDDLDGWDHVVEASIHLPSGVLVIRGTCAPKSTATRVRIEPGAYRLRWHIGGLNTISEDELEGRDFYRLVLWRDELREPEVLRQQTS